jgi:hypothetical protein
MRETIEFRIDEERARRFLEPGLGVPLNDTLRQVVLPLADAQVQRIGEIQREHRARGEFFFIYSEIHRAYSKRELQAAEVLELIPRARFEPSGSLCGTVYDDSVACGHCGAGGLQVSELLLDTRRIPKGKDIAQTIAGELIISSRLVNALGGHGIQGADYRPVMHRGRQGPEPSEWYQLIVTSKAVGVSPKTRVGINLFDLDETGTYRCPQGHMAGLNQLSELYVFGKSVGPGDWFITNKLFGVRRGELRPEARVLISQKLRQVLVDLKAKGFALEVAHLVL